MERNLRNKRRTKADSEPTFSSALRSALLGVIAAATLAFLLILVFAVAALFLEDPRPVMRFGGYFALYVSSAVGGYFAYLKCGGLPLSSGLLTGFAFAAANAVFSLLFGFQNGGMGIALSFVLRVLIVGAAVFGSFLGAFRPKTHGRRRRKNKFKKT